MKESPRKKVLLKLDGPKDACPLCKLNMEIKYTVSGSSNHFIIYLRSVLRNIKYILKR